MLDRKRGVVMDAAITITFKFHTHTKKNVIMSPNLHTTQLSVNVFDWCLFWPNLSKRKSTGNREKLYAT